MSEFKKKYVSKKLFKIIQTFLNKINLIYLMVLESLISPINAEKRPYEMFFIGFLYSSISIILSLWVFRSQSSMVMVLLTVLACMPLIHSTIKYEASKNETREIFLLREHTRALYFFIFLFLGMTASFSIWYVFLPEATITTLYRSQLNTIAEINAKILGFSIRPEYFVPIFLNNTKVLLFCIFFSFFYGAGAIFILTWNATVISAAIGSFIRKEIVLIADKLSLTGISSYFHIFSVGILKYLTHGIVEILAYFIGGLAGGIISIAVIRHSEDPRKFKKAMYDSLSLFLIALLLVIIGALIEVFITPTLF